MINLHIYMYMYMYMLHCHVFEFSMRSSSKVRGNFVEDEYYQMATEFQETSLRPDISVAYT